MAAKTFVSIDSTTISLLRERREEIYVKFCLLGGKGAGEERKKPYWVQTFLLEILDPFLLVVFSSFSKGEKLRLDQLFRKRKREGKIRKNIGKEKKEESKKKKEMKPI